MNKDQREALKVYLMIGAPIMLVVGSVIPSFLILPISFTLFFGTFMGAYLFGDIKPEQETWKTKVIVFCILIIILTWVSIAYEQHYG